MSSSSRRKLHVSFGEDDVSEMSSSFGSTNTVSIFRPKPPPSYDEDESLLLHKAVDAVLDQAMGRSQSRFDVDAMTTEEELIQRLGNLKSQEEASLGTYDQFEWRSVQDPLAPPAANATLPPPRQARRSSPDPRCLMEEDPSVADETSLQSKGPYATCKRYLWVFFLLFVVACTLGGVAGLVTILLQERETNSVTSQEQVGPLYLNPTGSPSSTPSASPTYTPSLDPTIQHTTTPSLPPTPAPTTQSPTPFPTSGPTTPSPSTLPTVVPTTVAPTRELTFSKTIAIASPETETALLDATSPQSLALQRIMSNTPSFDAFALFTLLYSANVTAWDETLPYCSWIGISCDSNGSVQKVELRHYDLIGTLPAELALATNLRVISIAGSGTSDIKSNIRGSIPALWGELLTNLRALELYDNRLGGRIPGSFWKFSNLENFHLDGNQLTGIFPDSLASMTSLKTFDLSNNHMVGTIPEDWTSLSNLARLSLKGNQMYGTIPNGMGDLTMLQELYLQGNSFRGRLPSDLSSLTSLGWLALEENQFTGTLPLGYSAMASLEGLELRGNKFRGTLPASYGSMSLLRILDVSSNLLSGSIPSEWDLLLNLAALSLHNNALHGVVSDTICVTVMHVASDCNENMECSCCTDCFISS